MAGAAAPPGGAPKTMSRADQVINTLLVLAWLLLLVRLGRIYLGGDAVDESLTGTTDGGSSLNAVAITLPTPTAITGPQALRPIVGKCFYFLEKVGGGNDRKYEYCAFRSVRMILMANYQANVCGHWAAWKTEEKDGKTKFLAQHYTNGEMCVGFGARETEVVFKCDKTATALRMISAGEYDICKYRLVLATKAWCEVDPTATVDPPPA